MKRTASLVLCCLLAACAARGGTLSEDDLKYRAAIDPRLIRRFLCRDCKVVPPLRVGGGQSFGRRNGPNAVAREGRQSVGVARVGGGACDVKGYHLRKNGEDEIDRGLVF